MLLLIDELRCVDERLGCCFSSVVVGNLLWRNSALEIWIHLLNQFFNGAALNNVRSLGLPNLTQALTNVAVEYVGYARGLGCELFLYRCSKCSVLTK